MKSTLLMLPMLLIMAVAAQAQPAEKFNYAVSEVSVSSFNKLVVNANVDVVLVQNDSLKKAYIEGDEKLVPEISITVSDGVMTIASSHKQTSYRGKVQVNVTVQELQKLEINADAGVVSFDALHSPKLFVNINGFCDLHLKSNGKIFLDADEDYWIKYRNISSEKSNVVVRGGSEG
ncbi:MAG: DUF2807 domain-containing protein [Chitinophagaceae bacterium]